MNFVTLKDVDWDDEEMWDGFIDQMTVDEMLTLKADNNGADNDRKYPHTYIPTRDPACYRKYH